MWDKWNSLSITPYIIMPLWLWFEMGSALYYELVGHWSLFPPSHSRVLTKSPSPALHPPQKYKDRGILHPKRSTDDRSDQSSVKSTDSSSYPSPCASPSPPSSGKVQYLQVDRARTRWLAHFTLHIEAKWQYSSIFGY